MRHENGPSLIGGEKAQGAAVALDSRIAIESERDIVVARSEGRILAAELGFGLADQTRLATAISELTRNVLRYAGKGTCTLINASDPGMYRVQVIVEDQGPGIHDIGEAMEDGFTTGQGLGAGLPGTKRLVSSFEIDSAPGGTKVTIEIARKRK